MKRLLADSLGLLIWCLFAALSAVLGFVLHAHWPTPAVMWPFAIAFGIGHGVALACWDAIAEGMEVEA